MPDRIHVALAVPDLDAAIADYTRRLGVAPRVIARGAYALFRTPILNLSISAAPGTPARLRHLGFEDARSASFSELTDASGIVWERFSSAQQEEEIRARWPDAEWRD